VEYFICFPFVYIIISDLPLSLSLISLVVCSFYNVGVGVSCNGCLREWAKGQRKKLREKENKKAKLCYLWAFE